MEKQGQLAPKKASTSSIDESYIPCYKISFFFSVVQYHAIDSVPILASCERYLSVPPILPQVQDETSPKALRNSINMISFGCPFQLLFSRTEHLTEK